MPKRITDAYLDRYRPERAEEVADDLRPGLVIRFLPSGRHSYRLRPRIGGRQRTVTLGVYPKMGIAEARERARDCQRQLAAGAHPLQTGTPAGALTVEDLYEAWMRDHVGPNRRPATRRGYEGWWRRNLLPTLGDVPAEAVSRSDLRRVLYDLAKRAPTEANRTLAAFRAAFGWAVRVDLVASSPADRFPAPSSERPRETVLSPDELGEAWSVMAEDGSPAARAMMVATLTLCRIGELLPLHAGDIVERGDGRWLEIPAGRTKGRRAHAVPVSGALDRLLAPPADGFYFSSPRQRGPITSYSSALRRLQQKSGLPLGPHVLRTTTATLLAQGGVQDHVIAALLAHQPQSVTTRHYQLYRYDAERRVALEEWGRRVEALGPYHPTTPTRA